MTARAPLPIQPWRDWLQGQLALHNGSYRVLSSSLGLSDRRVREFMNDEKMKSISYKSIDSALTHYGSTRPEEIYPGIMEMSQAIRPGGHCTRCKEPLMWAAKLCGFCIEEELL
jgi:hypothetical protein